MYAVLFQGTFGTNPYQPITFGKHGVDSGITVPHGLDREVAAALPGLWYCLHLPNTLFELVDIPAAVLADAQRLDFGHGVVLCPIGCFDAEHLAGLGPPSAPIVTVCPDDLLDEAQQRSEALGFVLPAVPFSEFSDASLSEHWRAIYALVETDRPYLDRPLALTRNFMSVAADLPRRWLARQLDADDAQAAETPDGDADVAIAHALDTHLFFRLAVGLAAHDDASSVSDDAVAQARAEFRLPISLAVPGVAPTYIKNAYEAPLIEMMRRERKASSMERPTTSALQPSGADLERSVFRFLVAHRGIARTGVGIVTADVPGEAFGVLAQLESLMATDRPNAKSVWKLLDRLSDVAAPIWSNMSRAAVARASTLTAFTNFPIGLLRVPGQTAPLSASVPITYRPLLPLTRALQTELHYVPAVVWKEQVRVLVAECISEHDRVGALARLGWAATRDFLSGVKSRVAIEVVDTTSVADLRQAVAHHRPDLLVISAHGVQSASGAAAGLQIGEQVVIGGLGPLPPVVILSACHVAPRGAGAVSVADLLLREGAIAVLGTQVPVDVRKNSALTGRLLFNIADALSRDESVDLLEVWRHVQAGNAVLDILEGNSMLAEWGIKRAPSGRTVLEEFMAIRSTGRLRRGDVYVDSEAVLGEIADDMSMGPSVRNWFRNPGYVPESLFYGFLGNPERVLLGEPTT